MLPSMEAAHRIALISDIHGNAIALREVLRAVERQGADEIVCLGDVATLGVAPGEVIEQLQQLGCRCIMGNHDDYLLDAQRIHAYTDDALIIEAVEWCREQLSADQIEFVSGFEKGMELALGGRHRLKLFHGSPSSNSVDLLADTPSDLFDQQLGPDRAPVMARGHTHIQMLRKHRGTLMVNPGSVGAPFEALPTNGRPKILDHAEYASVEVRDGELGITLHRMALDRAELRKAARSSKNPMREALAVPYL